MTPFDPQSGDPLHVPGPDQILPSAEYVAGYDAGWSDAALVRPRLVQVTAFGLGIVVGMAIATVLFFSAAGAAPRSGPALDSTALFDVSQGASGPGLSQSGAPRLDIRGAPWRSSAGGAGTVSAPAILTGNATYYDAPSPRDAAAGPALRKALGRGWRDSTVEVCASICIEVVLSDWCACGHGHVIDLDDRAFARLAPLSQGVVRVRVFAGPASRPRVSPPPTDVGE